MKCDLCEYETTRKSNLKRHTAVVHGLTETIHQCAFCDQIFTDVSNCKRHMVSRCTKRPDAPKVYTDAPKVYLDAPKVYLNAPKVYQDAPCDSEDGTVYTNALSCTRCGATFTRKSSLWRHNSRCKGVPTDPLECVLCMKRFSSNKSKCRHERICIEVAASRKQVINTTNNTNNHTTNNDNRTINNNTLGKQHIQSGGVAIDSLTNNINIIAFKPGDNEQLQLITEHITADVLKQLVRMSENSDVLTSYTEHLLDNPRNRCVKKTNLRTGHSEVHVGNNEWKIFQDKQVYPKLVADVASCFADFLNGHRRQMNHATFMRLVEFVDYMSDQGYCNTDDREKEREIKASYRDILQRTKYTCYNATKQTDDKPNSVSEAVELPH